MSHRSRDEKKLNRLRHALRRTPDGNIDLIAWVRDHRHADTAGGARRFLEDGRVKAGDEIVGRYDAAPLPEDPEAEHKPRWVVDQYVPAGLRSKLTVA